MRRLVAFILFLIIYNFAKAQVITTIAGDGTQGFSGDNGLALSSELSNPSNVSMDRMGNILIADINNNRIRKINTAGIITTIAGTDTLGYNGDGIMATAAELSFPSCAVVDKYGNILIADVLNYRIREIDTLGIIHTIAGNGSVGFSGDNSPATDAEMNQPLAVAVDSFGNIYIADAFNNRIRKVNNNGIITTVAGSGVAGYSGDGFPATLAHLNMPVRVALDEIGNLFLSDGSNHIRKVDTSGIITTIAGSGTAGYNGDNIQATTAQLNTPVGIIVSNNGIIYFADGFNNRVRKIDTNGIITTIAGNGHAGFSGDGGPADSAELNGPNGLCIDGSGDIIFADFSNNRVRKISYTNGVPVVGGVGVGVRVYPNPVNSTLYFEFPWSPSVTIELLDIAGRIMNEQVVYKNTSASVDVSSYTPGIYIYQVTTMNKTQTGKIVIE